MDNQFKHFTLLENGADCESPMIGTINNIANNMLGLSSFRKRVADALAEHFDHTDIILPAELPDIFNIYGFEDFDVKIDGNTYSIRILETWNY